MRKLSLLVLSALIAATTGCTVTSYRQEEVSAIPQERAFLFKEPAPNTAVLRVTRLNNHGASACYFSFLIDDERAARLDTEEQAVFYLPAGRHKLQVTHDWEGRGLCGLISEEESAKTYGQIRYVDLEANFEYDIRLGFNSWGGVYRLFTDDSPKPVVGR